MEEGEEHEHKLFTKKRTRTAVEDDQTAPKRVHAE